MSDGGREIIAAIEEVTLGVTPASQLRKVAFATSENLGMETSTTQSNAIRGDYVSPQVVRTNVQGNGGFPFELAYQDGPMEKFIEGALRNAWSSAKTTGPTTLAAASSGNKYTRAAGSFLTDGWAVGMGGIATGFSNAANNGVFVVTAVIALELTVALLDLVDEAGSGDEALNNNGAIWNGITLKSYTVERNFADLTNRWIAHPGLRVNELSLSAQLEQIVTGQVTFLGKQPSALAAATAGAGAHLESLGVLNEIMNGVEHVTGIFSGSANNPGIVAVPFMVQQIDLRIGSPVRPIGGLGTLGPQAIGGNRFQIGGMFRSYTDDNAITIWNDYRNYTQKSLCYRYQDSAGKLYLVYNEQVQLTALEGPNSGGPDSDIFQGATFVNELGAQSGRVITITRIGTLS